MTNERLPDTPMTGLPDSFPLLRLKEEDVRCSIEQQVYLAAMLDQPFVALEPWTLWLYEAIDLAQAAGIRKLYGAIPYKP